MRKQITYAILIFQVLLIVSLVRNIQLSVSSRGRVGDLREQKIKLEKEKEVLKQKLEYVGSDYYLEKVAREELQLTKPGETLVLIPSAAVVEIKISESDGDTGEEKQNWQKWWEVIVGRD